MEPANQIRDAVKQSPMEQDQGGPIAFHDQLASTWETNYQSKAFLSRVEAFEGALREHDLRSKLWLDAGCGSGTLSRWLVGRGAEVVGIDGAPEMVRTAKATARVEVDKGDLRFQVANIGALPFPDCMFDGVLCSSVLEYADDPDSCLNEIGRVIKSGGTLLISVPNAESLVRLGLRMAFRLTSMIGRPRPRYMSHSRHQFSKPQFSALLRAHGFEPDYTTAFGSGLPGWLRGRNWYGRLLLFRADKLTNS